MASSASSSLLWFSSLVFMLSLALNTNHAVCETTQFEVGGTDGWRIPDNNDTTFYIRWAADNRFHVGDSLSFVYRNDSVLVVDKYGYYHCNTSKPIYAFHFESGKTLVKLDRPGPFYFTSGLPDHCKNGQRLEVDVMSLTPPRPITIPPSQADSDGSAPAPGPSSALMVSVSALVSALAAGLTCLASSF